MKKTFLAALSAIVLLAAGLFAAAPANAAETVSNASLFVANGSAAPVYYQTASGGPAIYTASSGQSHYAPYGDPITKFYVRAGCTMTITGNGTYYRSGGAWYTWALSNGIRQSGTATIKVTC